MENQRGFSMIEMLIVLVIAGIVVALTIPQAQRYKTSLNRVAAYQQLEADFAYARQAAVTRRTPVFIKFGTPPTTTNISSYVIHMDLNEDRAVSSGEPQQNRTMPRGTLLESVALTPVDSLVFETSGILRAGTSGGRIVVKTGSVRDTLTVSTSGIVYRI